jgi:hypothetical protein
MWIHTESFGYDALYHIRLWLWTWSVIFNVFTGRDFFGIKYVEADVCIRTPDNINGREIVLE